MTQEIINIGKSANSGDGDDLRSAFNKTNSNFTELYNIVGSNGQSNSAADFVLVGSHGGLENSRLLTAGYGIALDDAGQGSTLTVRLTDNPISSGIYSNATVTIDSNGHVVDVSSGAGSGYTGSAGNQGYVGSAGPKGYTGSQSTVIGYTGSVGYTGSSGAFAAVGYTGSEGYTGSSGYTGSIGSNGYTGSIGYTGSQGIQGLIGIPGNLGYTGSVGYTGSSGAFAGVGYTGSQGDLGYTGSVGYTGSSGAFAAVGYTGSQSTVIGYTGSLGYTGSIGYTGSQSTVIGYTGSIGYDGSRGNVGYTGSLGYTGSVGGLGYSGSIGYTGSKGNAGYTGSLGYSGSIGLTAIGGSYIHTQASPNTTWTITHNLGVQYVNVEVIDSSGNSLVGTYDYPIVAFTDSNTVTLTFTSTTSGYASITSGGGQMGYTGSLGYTGSFGAMGSYTVATLPVGILGQMAIVTDGFAGLSWGNTITGGGSTKYLVWCNGTAWTVIGK